MNNIEIINNIVVSKIIPNNDYEQTYLKLLKQALLNLQQSTHYKTKEKYTNEVYYRLNAFGITKDDIDLLKEIIDELPLRYYNEFVYDVLIDQYSINSLRKVYIYYIDDIIGELSNYERKQMGL